MAESVYTRWRGLGEQYSGSELPINIINRLNERHYQKSATNKSGAQGKEQFGD